MPSVNSDRVTAREEPDGSLWLQGNFYHFSCVCAARAAVSHTSAAEGFSSRLGQRCDLPALEWHVDKAWSAGRYCWDHLCRRMACPGILSGLVGRFALLGAIPRRYRAFR